MTCSDMYYIGFDLSTQALKAFVIDSHLDLKSEVSVRYVEDLPHYKTTEGFHRKNDVVTSPVAMWLEALDLLLERLSNAIDLRRVVSVGGCGQQHGTVYTAHGFLAKLQNLDPNQRLQEELAAHLALPNSPIWLDCSTERYCRRLEEEWGVERLVERTGSRAHARFSLQQIHKVVEETPDTYSSTERILLVSNFLASLLAGQYMPIDFSDGSGMNLLDIYEKTWIGELARLYGGVDVREKVGEPGPTIMEGGEAALNISPYYTSRYGIRPDCRVSGATGDNPATLMAMLLRSNDLILSLGTSDVLIGVADEIVPSRDIHVFCNPLNSDNHMFIICYKNASLVREELKEKYCNGSWDVYNEYLTSGPPDEELVGNYFPLPETCPAGMCGNFSSSPDTPLFSHPPATIVRTITEGQFLAKAHDIARAGFTPTPTSRLIVVGGGSVNSSLLSVISNVFGVDVYRGDSTGNAAARGAAYLAYAGLNGVEQLRERSVGRVELVCRASGEVHDVYKGMKERYAELQADALTNMRLN